MQDQITYASLRPKKLMQIQDHITNANSIKDQITCANSIYI